VRRLHGARGQAAVEFAIVTPVIAVVVIALVAVTTTGSTRLAEESILRDAAHAAAVASDATAAAQRVLADHGRDDLVVDVLLDGQLLQVTLRDNNGDSVAAVSVAAAPP